jgi:hypothetical protein
MVDMVTTSQTTQDTTMTTTIQQTSKGLKLQQIVAVVLMLIGFGVIMFRPESPIAGLLFLGLVWWVVVKMLIWWRHK